MMEAVIAAFIAWGPPGLIIAALLLDRYQSRADWKEERNALQAKVEKAQDDTRSCQETRITEGRESIRVLTEAAAAMRAASDAQTKAADSSRDIAEAVRALQTEIERRERA